MQHIGFEASEPLDLSYSSYLGYLSSRLARCCHRSTLYTCIDMILIVGSSPPAMRATATLDRLHITLGCCVGSSRSTLRPRSASLFHKASNKDGRGSTLRPLAAAGTQVLLPSVVPTPSTGGSSKTKAAQRRILECLAGVSGRGKGGMDGDKQTILEAAVAELERDGGASAPADNPRLQGRWRLLYTSRPGTASPIQRVFTGVDSFSVFQDIRFDCTGSVRVDNIVDFGPSIGYLKVEAEASTLQKPLPGFTPRQGKGLPFGILGVSSSAPPAFPDQRIDFQFDKAAFYFKFLPFTLPYPVPFKLLGDETKGWLDITYLDASLRIARGNKGTLFILVKDDPPTTKLLDRIAAGAKDSEILEYIEEVGNSSDGVVSPAKSSLAAGAWRLVWTQQGEKANALQKALAKKVGNWQIISEGGAKLENRVELLPGVRVKALASTAADSSTRTMVKIEGTVLEIGALRLSLPVRTDGTGYIDWLYLDGRMRITRGSKGSVFVHVRDDNFDE